MKKILLILISMFIMLPVSLQAKDRSKELQKRAKQTEKRFTKEGWKIFGSTISLREALVKHYEKLERLGDGAKEMSGTAATSESKSNNLAIQAASSNAYNDYAKQCRQIVGKTVNSMELSDQEKDDFLATYASNIKAEIQGQLQQSFVLIRQGKDNLREAQVFFVVDEDVLETSRHRALEKAMRGFELAKTLRDKLNEAAKEQVE